MVSLVLLAVAAALSLPSYRDMIEKRQLTHGAEQIMAFVNSAQLESAKQNQPVTISWSLTASDNWCFGTIVSATACDCTETQPGETDFCAINSVPTVITNFNAANHDLLRSVSGDSDYTFDPVRGIFDGFTDPLVVEMSSNGDSFSLTLVMNQAGQATLCSSNSDHSIPGYPVCDLPDPDDA
jgi:Tfp pilus assembly protein FimT